VSTWATGVVTPLPPMIEAVAAFLGIAPGAVRAARAGCGEDPADPDRRHALPAARAPVRALVHGDNAAYRGGGARPLRAPAGRT
jgi:hypothetical protein